MKNRKKGDKGCITPGKILQNVQDLSDILWLWGRNGKSKNDLKNLQQLQLKQRGKE
jgi:hypothetical protein